MNQIFIQIGRLLQQYTLGQKLVLFSVLIGLLSAITAMVIWANRPEYELLYSNLDSNAASQIVGDLRSSKIRYRLENNGGAIYVPRESVSELRLKFTEAGYVGQTAPGYEIFDKSSIGMTTFMQRLNMRRALEGELVRTINQFTEIKQSRVHLVLPENKLFDRENNGSASVVLYLKPGAYLKPSQVRGIAAMVSNSVEGIDPSDVVVVDSNGDLLVDRQGDDSVLGSVGSKWDLRHSVELEMQRKVLDIVEGIVGGGKAVVKVTTDLNFEQVERTKEEFDPENVVILSEERHTESSNGKDTSEFKKENVITNYEINKSVERYVGNTGDINRVSVAVLVDGSYQVKKDPSGNEKKEYVPRNAAELGQISNLVKSAVGYTEARGDFIEVQNLQFDRSVYESDQAHFAALEKSEKWETLLTRGLIVLGILVALFLVRTLLKSTTGALPAMAGAASGHLLGGGGNMALAEGSPMSEDASHEDSSLSGMSPDSKAKMKAKQKMTEEIMKFSKDKPDDASQLIRSWIAQSNS